jgi:hypothetical protein
MKGNNTNRHSLTLVATLAAGLCLALAGWARAATIDFVVQPGTGNVFFGGGTGRTSGDEIAIDFVLGTDTPGGLPLPFDCIDCTLTFLTGEFIGPTPNGRGWVFGSGPGSAITITGGVDLNGDGTADIGPGFPFLLAGQFIGPIITVDFVADGWALGFTSAAFFDFKHPLLAGYYGLPPLPFEGELQLIWGGIGEPPGPYVGTPRIGLVRNTFVTEPGTVVFFGIGFLGLVRALRRRKHA